MSVPNIFLKVQYYLPENKKDAKKAQKRKFYSSNQPNGDDYMKYIDKGVKEGEVYDYIDYAGAEEKSCGVFGESGLLNEKEKKKIRKMLRSTNSVIWDVVISFTEEFGKEKMKSYLDALELIKKHLPHLVKNNNMNYENIVWYAGLHENTDNRHIHLSFFEKVPLHNRQNKKGLFFRRGRLNKTSIEKMKVEMEIDLQRINYSFESFRRNLMMDTEEFLLKDKSFDRKIKRKILSLYNQLPKGRLSYNSQNMISLRPLVKEIESLIIKKSPTMKEELQRIKKELFLRDEEVKKICKKQKIKHDDYLIKDKFIEDMHRRLGNKIIKYAKAYGNENNKTSSKRKQKNMQKKKRKDLLMQTIKLTREVDYEAIEIFENYRKMIQENELEKVSEMDEENSN